jgi:hypothetical protein
MKATMDAPDDTAATEPTSVLDDIEVTAALVEMQGRVESLRVLRAFGVDADTVYRDWTPEESDLVVTLERGDAVPARQMLYRDEAGVCHTALIYRLDNIESVLTIEGW